MIFFFNAVEPDEVDPEVAWEGAFPSNRDWIICWSWFFVWQRWVNLGWQNKELIVWQLMIYYNYIYYVSIFTFTHQLPKCRWIDHTYLPYIVWVWRIDEVDPHVLLSQDVKVLELVCRCNPWNFNEIMRSHTNQALQGWTYTSYTWGFSNPLKKGELYNPRTTQFIRSFKGGISYKL